MGIEPFLDGLHDADSRAGRAPKVRGSPFDADGLFSRDHCATLADCNGSQLAQRMRIAKRRTAIHAALPQILAQREREPNVDHAVARTRVNGGARFAFQNLRKNADCVAG